MAKCDGCAGSRCSCKIIAGANTSVTGAGTNSNPYIVSTQGAEGSAMPTGSIIMFGTGVPPAGYLVANGQAVSRTTYAALFSVIGTLYGAGDGSVTFNLPDLAGTFPLGADPAAGGVWAQDGVVRGNVGGQLTLSSAQLPPHAHTMAHVHDIAHNHSASSGAVGDHSHGGQTGGQSADHYHLPFGGEGWHLKVGSVGNGGFYTVQAYSPLNDGGPNTQAVLGSSTATTSNDHVHGIVADGAHSHSITVNAFAGNSGGSSNANTGNGPGTYAAVNIMPPYLALTFLIKT